jgi:hypothetical protein
VQAVHGDLGRRAVSGDLEPRPELQRAVRGGLGPLAAPGAPFLRRTRLLPGPMLRPRRRPLRQRLAIRGISAYVKFLSEASAEISVEVVRYATTDCGRAIAESW